ncbi:MAG: 2-oxoacid:acceptor oxidoreductase subunit alpha [Nitrospirae bacterium]|nr:2-oxoacid:acceptor oxidoreductase subunit alpha [Nitrospirota bacterium]
MEVNMDYTILIGGEAGQGLQTIGGALSKLLSRAGYHVFSHQDYMSRVRGGHNLYQIRFADREITSPRSKADILVALDLKTIELHKGELTESGIIVYDADFIKKTFDSPEYLHVPFDKIAVESGGSKIMSNTAAVGAVLGMIGMELTVFEDIVRKAFRKKGQEVIDKNLATARAGHDFATRECRRCSFVVPKTANSGYMLINGADAIGLGALMSGCKFYCGYPMTPSTGILNYMGSKAIEYGVMVEQTEDEICAINMALGASFAGVRAMTGSAGGGFALMVEGLSLAGMVELPIVIAVMQRPGPATGLPTRTEQGDLLFTLYAGHGEFPRAVFAPGTPEQAFYLTNKAFDIAEKYQIPSFIIADQYLVDTEWTFVGFDTKKLLYNDYRLSGDALGKTGEYKRYAYSENGVSPLAVPGLSKHLVVVDSDEHDEEGHMIEDGETRNRMVEKRLFQKFPLIRNEISPPEYVGPPNPEIVVAGWGSTYGVIKEAVGILKDKYKIGMLHFSELYPFPGTEKFDFMSLLFEAKLTICVENNATGQFETLVKASTGYGFGVSIRKYDGRQFILDELIGELDGYANRL